MVVLKVIYLRVVHRVTIGGQVMDRAIWFMEGDHGSLRHSICELSRIVIVSWSVMVVVQIEDWGMICSDVSG